MKKVLVRSSGHLVLLTVLQQGGFLAAEGLDPVFELCDMADDADEQLLAGEVDMISGCHHTPYLQYDEGKPFVYLASTTNQVQERFVTREPIGDLAEMRGRKVALPPLAAPGVRPDQQGEGHPRANRQIMLERAGIADAIDYVGYGPGGALAKERLQSVADGYADGAFVPDYELANVQELGLSALELPALPMITGVTCTTTWNKVKEHAESQTFERFVRALRAAVEFFKTERDATIEILTKNADQLRLRDEGQVLRRYDRTSGELDPTLTPTAGAIRNAFRIAEFERPGIGDRVNPLTLWDLHFVRAALAGAPA